MKKISLVIQTLFFSALICGSAFAAQKNIEAVESQNSYPQTPLESPSQKDQALLDAWKEYVKVLAKEKDDARREIKILKEKIEALESQPKPAESGQGGLSFEKKQIQALTSKINTLQFENQLLKS